MWHHLRRVHPEKIEPEKEAHSGSGDVQASSSSTKKSSIVSLWKLRSQEQRNEMFQTSIPGWIEAKKMLPFNDPRAQVLRSQNRHCQLSKLAMPVAVTLNVVNLILISPLQRYHKSIFECMILDLVPFSEVNKPGFLRHHQLLVPNFKVASEKYYR